MIERQIELGRRYHRKKKMHKLKAKLATATGEERDAVLAKIRHLSPMWTEASLKPATTEEAAAPAADAEPKKKAPPRKPAAK